MKIKNEINLNSFVIHCKETKYYNVNIKARNYEEAEKYLKKAVELMPEDATVNDHYGDILWKLNRNMQARYFWNYVLSLDNADEEIKQKINIKILEGLKNS